MRQGLFLAGSADLLTIAALAILAYFLAAVVHEGVGHGGACALLGGRLVSVSSVYCDCDYGNISRPRQRAIEAAGTAANLALGLCCAVAIAFFGPLSPTWRYFLWLCAIINLFQAGGYLLVSPFGRFGDWRNFLDGINAQLVWKVALTVAGLLISVATLQFGCKQLGYFLAQEDPLRGRQAWLLTALPFGIGAVVSCSIALLNPVDKLLALTSAGAATLGGTSWLLWIGYLAPSIAARTVVRPIVLVSSPIAIALALIALAVWVFVLGPGTFIRTSRLPYS
jgi:hypothetical protein